MEQIELDITDAFGHQLSFEEYVAPMGATWNAGVETFTFDIPLEANPINVFLNSETGNGFPQQTIWWLLSDCPDLPPSNQPGAIGIPPGFVFATIICDTPMYNIRRGSPSVMPRSPMGRLGTSTRSQSMAQMGISGRRFS